MDIDGSPDTFKRTGNIYHGFHVYLQYPVDLLLSIGEIIIPVQCYLKDLVGVNKDKTKTVYKRVFLSKKSL